MSKISKISYNIPGLFIANKPTESGNIYTSECLILIERQILTNKLTVQEMNSPEREKLRIPVYEPIQSRVMAIITSVSINGDSLDCVIETKSTREGKKLNGIIDTLGGLDKLNFIPVGLGYTNEKNEVYNYILKYVTIEPIS